MVIGKKKKKSSLLEIRRIMSFLFLLCLRKTGFLFFYVFVHVNGLTSLDFGRWSALSANWLDVGRRLNLWRLVINSSYVCGEHWIFDVTLIEVSGWRFGGRADGGRGSCLEAVECLLTLFLNAGCLFGAGLSQHDCVLLTVLSQISWMLLPVLTQSVRVYHTWYVDGRFFSVQDLGDLKLMQR